MKKILLGLSMLMVSAGVLLAQEPVLSINRLQLDGAVGDTLAGKFDIYNTGGTTDVSHVTIVSTDTNIITVNQSSATISNNYLQVTATVASGLSAGTYRAGVIVTQTNSPETVLRLPVTVTLTRDTGIARGSLAVEQLRDAMVYNTPQLDTSATTATTEYKPRRIGGILIGRIHANTGAVWTAHGLTTNDWTKIGP